MVLGLRYFNRCGYFEKVCNIFCEWIYSLLKLKVDARLKGEMQISFLLFHCNHRQSKDSFDYLCCNIIDHSKKYGDMSIIP